MSDNQEESLKAKQTRELGHLSKDNIISKEDASEEPVSSLKAAGERSDRVGGLTYYKDRNTKL